MRWWAGRCFVSDSHTRIRLRQYTNTPAPIARTAQPQALYGIHIQGCRETVEVDPGYGGHRRQGSDGLLAIHIQTPSNGRLPASNHSALWDNTSEENHQFVSNSHTRPERPQLRIQPVTFVSDSHTDFSPAKHEGLVSDSHTRIRLRQHTHTPAPTSENYPATGSVWDSHTRPGLQPLKPQLFSFVSDSHTKGRGKRLRWIRVTATIVSKDQATR